MTQKDIKEKISYPLEKLQNFRGSEGRHYVYLLIRTRLLLIKCLPDIESLINLIFRRCVTLQFLLLKKPYLKNKILSTLESLPKSSMMILKDKLVSSESDKNILHLLLFKILLQELISRGKGLRPFWTPAFKELSDKLSSPIEIDWQDSDLNLSRNSSPKLEEHSKLLTMKTTKVQNKNWQKISCPLSTSTVVDKWVKESIKPVLKSKRVRIRPDDFQKQILRQWFKTSNYVYNKAVDKIEEDKKFLNFYTLRNLLVTESSKTDSPVYKKRLELLKEQSSNEIIQKITELKHQLKQIPAVKNQNVEEWELETPKEIRANAVNDVCKAYKTGFVNIKRSNIKFFKMKYRESNHKSVLLGKNQLKIKDGRLRICPKTMKQEMKLGINTELDFEIKNDCRLALKRGKYYLFIPQTCPTTERRYPTNYCGIDPGIKQFMTTFSNTGSTEYLWNEKILNKLNGKINTLKSISKKISIGEFQKKKKPQVEKKREKGKRIGIRNFRKKDLTKLEERRENLIDELHWKTINELTKQHDSIFYGDIKSHDIVSKKGSRKLHLTFNSLKFYQFKQRLAYKCHVQGKLFVPVNESYTSQTCSTCGQIKKPYLSRVFTCPVCKIKMGRDTNAAKNILLKGLMTLL